MKKPSCSFWFTAMLLGWLLVGCGSTSPEVDDQGLYFLGNDGTGTAVWRMDRKGSSTLLFRVIDVEAYEGDTGVIQMISTKRSAFLVLANYYDPQTHRMTVGSLWATDGTPEGTSALGDISLISSPAVFGDDVLFRSPGGVMKSDGTPQGTELFLEDFQPGQFFVAENRVYFRTKTQDNTWSLAVSDGTPAGTELNPGGWIDPDGNKLTTAIGDVCYDWIFSRYPPAAEKRASLRKMDGTTSSIVFGTDNTYYFFFMFAFGDWVMFAQGGELWRSDGTEGGTMLIKQIREPPSPSSTLPYYYIPPWEVPAHVTYAGTLWFTVAPKESTPAETKVLWKSDGTEEGTGQVDWAAIADVSTEGARRSVSTEGLVLLGDSLCFVTRTYSPDGKTYTLWKTDGTEEGTLELKTMPEIGSNLVSLGQFVYFVADDGETGRELWKTDGTPEGTVQVIDFWPGVGSGISGSEPAGILGVGP